MSKIVLAFLMIVSAHTLLAQPKAYDSKLDYQKTQQNVAAIDLPYAQDIVEDALKDYMGSKGHKGSSLRGMTVYRGVKLDPADSEVKDLHFKIERKNRRDKEASVIFLLVAKPSEDPLTRAPGDAPPLDNAKSFLDKLVAVVEAHSLDVQIKAQEDIVKKAQKKRNGLSDDQTDLEKKIRNTQSDLDQNKKDQLKQTQDMQSIANDDNAMKKANKKMNKLVDDQGSDQKKLRKYQTDLEQNKKDQEAQQQELEKQNQTLDSMKARRKA